MSTASGAGSVIMVVSILRARNMTVAVCIKCGAFKWGAFNPCETCGAKPNGPDEMALSMAISDHHFDKPSLERIAAEIRAGRPVPIDPAFVESLKDALASPTGQRMMGMFQAARGGATQGSGKSEGSRIVDCPACGQHLRVPVGRAGVRLRCPACKHTFMSPEIDARILKHLKAEFAVYLEAARSCPPAIAQQVVSLMYYAAEVHFQTLNPWYTPPRLLGSNSKTNILTNILKFKASGPALLQGFMKLTSDLMKYYHEPNSEVLQVIQRKCADGIAGVGYEEIQGIVPAIRD